MCSDERRPRIPYGRQSLDETDIEAVSEALRSPFITQGPRVEAFEQALCGVTRARHAVAVANGTAALHLAYAAAGIGPGEEIVTSPNTFVSTASAAVFLGGRPVFADIERGHQNLDPADVERRITPRTRAIVAVDFAGHPAQMDQLREIADRHGLRLIVDACHSLGARYKDRPVGTLADMTCLSFHPVKAVTTGEGGAVLTDDPELAQACRTARAHGMVREPARLDENHGPWYYEMQELGWNYRITDFQCALGVRQLAKLDRFIARRARLAQRYGEKLAPLTEVRLPREAPSVRSAWHLYVVEVAPERRRSVFEALRESGIGVQVHYIPVYRQPFYKRLLGLDPSHYPHCEQYYSRCISLPLFPTLTEAQQDRVVVELAKALSNAPTAAC
jgi:UDP-4-amino-4,6-dideoxy-N-acetyl-beta-L-altrosamine transaminase